MRVVDPGDRAALTAAQAKSGPPRHIHLRDVEHFKVMSGRMGAELDGVEVELGPDDDEFSIPAGRPHRFWPVEGAEEMRIRVRVDGGGPDGSVAPT